MITTETIVLMKRRRAKIACLTAYDYPFARILDQAGIEIVLVGDSAANVVAGEKNTLPISMEEMLYHTRVVARAVRNALVIADMPFLSYQGRIEDAVYNAGRFLKAGACGVKVEGAGIISKTVERLVELGIPVMGHLGLTPQSIHKFGGYGLRGKAPGEAARMIKDARQLEKSGCFSIVLEKIPAVLARKITRAVSVPTIGIGAGAGCDGQILVLHDMLGFKSEIVLKFVKKYANLDAAVRKAVRNYVAEVKSGAFPGREHSFE
jgi:3-methyl-2-oxobutanoate hydroxymethyltransferase